MPGMTYDTTVPRTERLLSLIINLLYHQGSGYSADEICDMDYFCYAYRHKRVFHRDIAYLRLAGVPVVSMTEREAYVIKREDYHRALARWLLLMFVPRPKVVRCLVTVEYLRDRPLGLCSTRQLAALGKVCIGTVVNDVQTLHMAMRHPGSPGDYVNITVRGRSVTLYDSQGL